MTYTTRPSCTNCIFNASPEEQVAEMRIQYNTGYCRKGHGVTSVPGAGDAKSEEIGALKAAECRDYQNVLDPFEGLPPHLSSVVDTTITLLPLTPVPSGDPDVPVRSCVQCPNLIKDEEMAEAGLWPVSACSARGILIRPNQVVMRATNCNYKRIGRREENMLDQMTLSPPYGNVTLIGEVGENMEMKEVHDREFQEPTTYETDQPIDDDDKANGIRAWRKVTDEESGNSVLLPVYDLNFFSEVERAKIPRTGDDEHPENYVDHQELVYKAAVLWRELDETPALWGVAGSGKTEFYRYMAWLMVLPFERISITNSSEIDDLAGKFHYEPDRGTYYQYGRIPNAWQKPGVICLDEPNVGPPEVWQFIRPLTDNSKQLVLDMNEGERLSRNDHCYLGLAMNPAWDVKNVGTAMLADADGSRLMHIFVDMPDAETERRIIKERVAQDGWDIDQEKLDLVMGIAVDLRGLCEAGALPITWGIRPQVKVARALKWFAPKQAYRLATADYLEPEQQRVILDIVQAHEVKPSPPSVRPRSMASKGQAAGGSVYDRRDGRVR